MRLFTRFTRRKADATSEADVPALASSHLPTILSKQILQLYSDLLSTLHSRPLTLALLCQSVKLPDLDTLLRLLIVVIFRAPVDHTGHRRSDNEPLLAAIRLTLCLSIAEVASPGHLLDKGTRNSCMLSTYTHSPSARDYVVATLSKQILRLFEHDRLTMEVDPVRVYAELTGEIEQRSGCLPPDLPRRISADTAATNPDIRAISEPRYRMLEEVMGVFLNLIIESLDDIPSGVRLLCKAIKVSLKERFPDISDDATCRVLGDFFFGRFICAVLEAPQAWLHESVVQLNAEMPRRNLSLISIGLRQFGSPSFADEDGYISALSPAIEKNRVRVNIFLQGLCNMNDTLELGMALPEIPLKLEILLNDLYFLHSLVSKHRDAVVGEAGEHLREVLVRLGSAPAPVPEDKNILLVLQLRA